MTDTTERKDDHLRINLEEDVKSGITTGFERFSFVHEALPEIDFNQVKTDCQFLGHNLKLPMLISSMTGGTPGGDRINLHLAQAAQLAGVAMGVGSQRVVIENPDSERSLKLRALAPDIPLFANIGAIQLNYGFTVEDCQRAVDLIEADGLILHLNPLQEVLQIGGQTNFSGLLLKIEQICKAIPVPVIAKEVGWGISGNAAKRLVDAGVSVIDVAGAGGTSWSEVEKYRTEDAIMFHVSSLFRNWGIPTADALQMAHQAVPGVPIIASGGLRRGIDLAKAIALGATLGGFAGRLLRAANESSEQVLALINEISMELKITMFATGTADIESLANINLVERKYG